MAIKGLPRLLADSYLFVRIVVWTDRNGRRRQLLRVFGFDN